mgnify:CR=1 FL=1
MSTSTCTAREDTTSSVQAARIGGQVHLIGVLTGGGEIDLAVAHDPFDHMGAQIILLGQGMATRHRNLAGRDRAGPGAGFGSRINWDGNFTINNVPPGRYLLRARGIRLREATSFGLPGVFRLSAQAPVAQRVLLERFKKANG